MTRTLWFFWLSRSLCLALFSYAVWLGSTCVLPIKRLVNDTHNYIDCQIPNAQNDRTFRVQSLSYLGVSSIAKALCGSDLLAESFNQVRVSWKSRRAQEHDVYTPDTRQHLILFSRDYDLDALTAPLDSPYTAIGALGVNQYNSHLWSLDPQFHLDRDYLAGKTVGLLNNPSSLSRYKLPLVKLKKIGIDKNSAQLRLYDSLNELEDALHQGEADVISVLATGKEALPGKLVLLGSVEPMMTYLDTSLASPIYVCRLNQMLNELFNTQDIFMGLEYTPEEIDCAF